MVIDKNTLIADQALELAQLKYELGRKNEALRLIELTIYCIGGPLNDNVLGFTKEQFSTFHQIMEHINSAG